MFWIKTLAILVLSFLLTLFLPWWGIAVAAFLAGLGFANKPGNDFLAGFLGVGLFWVGYAFWIDLQDGHQFSLKIAQLFSDGLGTTIAPVVLFVVTGILGGLIGGLSALSGGMILDNGTRHRKTGRHKKLTLNTR